MAFIKNASMCIFFKVKLINHDCLPILLLLYIMLYLVLAYLMLFAALSNAVCLYNAFFANVFVFMLFLGLLTHSLLFQILCCITHSAFNLLVFLILCSHRCFNERTMCSLEK